MRIGIVARASAQQTKHNVAAELMRLVEQLVKKHEVIIELTSYEALFGPLQGQVDELALFTVSPAARAKIRSFGWMLRDRLDDGAQVLISLGGDGTMMRTCRQVVQHAPEPTEVPIIGVNLGRVGFITSVDKGDAAQTILKMLDWWETEEGDGIIIEDRSALKYSTDQVDPRSGCAINDVVLKSDGCMVNLEVMINGDLAYTSFSDGLIIASATGSTAYALSAGGTIMHPSCKGIQLVQLNSQTLSQRPIMLPEFISVKVEVLQGSAVIIADGTEVGYLHREESITCKAKQAMTFWHPPTYNPYKALREKLNWQRLPGA